MSTTSRSTGRILAVAVRAIVMFTLTVGVGYTLLVTGIGQLFLPAQANGSLLKDASGEVVGSSLLGQSFTDADGAPKPEYFQPRPSAADYDAAGSSASNLGPSSEELVGLIQERRTEIAAFNGVDPAAVPADAVTASSSGLDPHISPAYAELQIERVATTRGLAVDAVAALVAEYTQAPALGYLGDPVVNVVELNLALDRIGA